jgi:membrane associated rhomboid family serine protease
MLGCVSEPELFVVCKNCSAEVSPYVTECPYCGRRVRKRAPKLERGAPAPSPPPPSPPPVQEEPEAPPKRRRAPRRPRMRVARETAAPWVAPDTRPYAVYGLVGLSLLVTVALAVRADLLLDLGVVGPVGGEWWRLFTTPFVHDNAGYQFVALVATAVFGMHLERRFGRLTVVLVFLLAGAAGAALATGLSLVPALGANGAAFGLLVAWFVDDRRAHRRGEERGSDLVGVAVFAAALLLLSVAWPPASIAAALGGAAVGGVLGLVFSAFRR